MRIMGLSEIPPWRPRIKDEYSNSNSVIRFSISLDPVCRRQSKTFDSEAIFTLAGVGGSIWSSLRRKPQGRASSLFRGRRATDNQINLLTL